MRIRERNIIKCFLAVLITIPHIACFTGCQYPGYNPEDAKTIAVQYMQDKYGVDFVPDHYTEYYEDNYGTVAGFAEGYPYHININVNIDETGQLCICDDEYFQIATQSMVKSWLKESMEEYTHFDDYYIYGSMNYLYSVQDTDVPEQINDILDKKSTAYLNFIILLPEDEYESNEDILEKMEDFMSYINKTEVQCSGRIFVYSNDIFNEFIEYDTIQEFMTKGNVASSISTVYLTDEIYIFGNHY